MTHYCAIVSRLLLHRAWRRFQLRWSWDLLLRLENGGSWGGGDETKRAARNGRQSGPSDQYVGKDGIVQQVAGRIQFVRRQIRKLECSFIFLRVNLV